MARRDGKLGLYSVVAYSDEILIESFEESLSRTMCTCRRIKTAYTMGLDMAKIKNPDKQYRRVVKDINRSGASLISEGEHKRFIIVFTRIF